MVLNSRRLEHFLAVVDTGTVTAAADVVHVTQSALSQSLKELEREVATPLFVRVGRRVQLTAAGEALVAPARRARRDLQNAAAAVAAVADVLAGHLDIACLPTLAVDPVAPLVGRFCAAYPGVEVRLGDADDPDELRGRVRAGEVELAITEWWHAAADADIVVHRLGVQDLVWLLPRDATAAPTTFAYVTTPRGSSNRLHLEEACARAGVPMRIAVEAAPREALVALVAAGAGAALVPRVLADRAAELDAVVVREPDPPVRRAVALVHRDGPLSPAAQRFAALALPAR